MFDKPTISVCDFLLYFLQYFFVYDNINKIKRYRKILRGRIMKIEYKNINEALNFYDIIEKKYKEKCYQCIEKINEST